MKSQRPLLPGLLLTSIFHAGAEELPAIKRIQLHDQFWSEGANFGYLGNDGKPDLIAGPFLAGRTAFSEAP